MSKPDLQPRFTEHLRLEPIDSRHIKDLQLLHSDETVAKWWAGTWTGVQARDFAQRAQSGWHDVGVHKWMAYDRSTGELVGRGGLSRLAPNDDRARQIARIVPGWTPGNLEVGWSIRTEFVGRGLATELGHEALNLAFGELDAGSVIAFTEVHNVRSRAVAERLNMRYVGEITSEGLVEGSDRVEPDAPFALYALARDTWASYDAFTGRHATSHERQTGQPPI